MKTLKDLEIAGHDVVRAEVVKWIKYYLEETNYEYSSVELMMKFNNIKDEDLK